MGTSNLMVLWTAASLQQTDARVCADPAELQYPPLELCTQMHAGDSEHSGRAASVSGGSHAHHGG